MLKGVPRNQETLNTLPPFPSAKITSMNVKYVDNAKTVPLFELKIEF